jgi:hypothetical protein
VKVVEEEFIARERLDACWLLPVLPPESKLLFVASEIYKYPLKKDDVDDILLPLELFSRIVWHKKRHL